MNLLHHNDASSSWDTFVTAPSQSDAALVLPESRFTESVDHFVRQALGALGVAFQEEGRSIAFDVPEADRPALGGREHYAVSLAAEGDVFDERAEFFDWLRGKFSTTDGAVNARPVGQPASVNDIAPALFHAYQIEGGQVHLGGCRLTDLPFLRLSYLAPDGATLRHVFVSEDGSTVSDQLAEKLGLADIELLSHEPTPRINQGMLDSLRSSGQRIAAKSVSQRDPSATAVAPKLVTLVWVKRVEGHLEFTVGEESASHSFGGWARNLKAEPFVGPFSGLSGFQLAATDEGEIDVAEGIGLCEHSGSRFLASDLVACSATGKRVHRRYTRRCPVSGEPCLEEAFETCACCGEEVGRPSLEDGECRACRSVATVSKDDPRVVWVLGEHPSLDAWKRWKISETEDVYVIRLASVLKSLLLVVHKETLAVRRIAKRGPFASRWAPLSEAEIQQTLG